MATTTKQSPAHRRRMSDKALPQGKAARTPKPPVQKPVISPSKLMNHLVARGTRPTSLFVFDTNVLMHDPTSLFRFEEHDIYIPMGVLEELDNNKKGMTEVARNARQVSRFLDEIVSSAVADMKQGIPLATHSHEAATGRLFFQTKPTKDNIALKLPQSKVDNQILGVVLELRTEQPDRPVVLVSKDINMRIKAHALGLQAEDYHSDMVMEDTDLLYSGSLALPEDFWDTHGKNLSSSKSGGKTHYVVSGPIVSSFLLNQHVYREHDGKPLDAIITKIEGKKATITTLTDHTHAKNNVRGITARNREQNFALNLLLDPEIDFVTLLGQAGTGKTLLALAAGLEQVMKKGDERYSDIIFTRATVPVGEDIGFLPGTEEEKMNPWMGAIDDNLEVLHACNRDKGDWDRASQNDLIRSRVKVKSLNFMRGRTFLNKFLIIDEAQNLTPKQMKTLITRAGPGTKVVCLGNIAQIDTPYLTEGSSGLTYAVDRFKGWAHSGHITLAKGERSRLADYAAEAL